ncbi:hypothetical protein CEF12_17025, partial [Enterococcus faecalis]
ILATGASQFSTQIRGSQTENYSNINFISALDGCSILATGASQFSTQIRGSQTENYSNINFISALDGC